LTTLAIIGNGLASHSFLFQLSLLKKNQFEKILIFEHDSFAPPCSFSTTAVASLRGTKSGLSELGDLIVEGFKDFENLVQAFSPEGVEKAIQYNGMIQCSDQFQRRFDDLKLTNEVQEVKLTKDFYLSTEEAFVINPEKYLAWMLKQSRKNLSFDLRKDFILEVFLDEGWKLKGNSGEVFAADQIVFCGGAYHRFWQTLFPGSILESSKVVPGSYVLFEKIKWEKESFSLTLEGMNLVYRKNDGQLLLGSTSSEGHIYLSKELELKKIYDFFKAHLILEFPEFSGGKVIVGMREKAKKRMPYIYSKEGVHFLGGFYKNGFTVSHLMAKKLIHQLQES